MAPKRYKPHRLAQLLSSVSRQEEKQREGGRTRRCSEEDRSNLDYGLQQKGLSHGKWPVCGRFFY